MTSAQLEKKYGIAIRDDSFYNVITHRWVKMYKIFSADGCQWENGLRTIKAVEAECKRYADALLNIKERVGKEG